MEDASIESVRLVAPSRWTSPEALEEAGANLAALGYAAAWDEEILARSGQLAGSDEQRAEHFLKAWNVSSADFIWAVRGGYGAQRILDRLADGIETERNKTYIGFSDSTSIHMLLAGLGIESIHGPVCSTLETTSPEDLQALKKTLEGRAPDLEIDTHAYNVAGVCEGRLIGGNLSIIQTMIGTEYLDIREGDILFIEDLDEMLYHLDRMLLHIKRAGLLARLSGIIVGGFTDFRDNTTSFGFSSDNPFGMSAEEILQSHLGELGVPLAYGFPAGHGPRNHPLILGRKARLEVGAQSSSLSYAPGG